MQLITGNTYPVKEQIKALGGTWDKSRQGWNVPDEKADEARALVEAAGPGKPGRFESVAAYGRRSRRGSRYVSNVTRFSSGAVVFTNKRGRCEDAPCCGCCS